MCSRLGALSFGQVIAESELRTTASGILLSSVVDNARRSNAELMAPIKVDVVANPAFNAVASKQQGIERISLFIGLADSLLSTIPRYLADPHGWPEVGEAGRETGTAFPRDRERSGFAANAATAAMYFVVAHEAAHILRGHLHYLDSHLLPEVGYGRSACAPSSELRAIEVDADRLAAVQFVDNAVGALAGQPIPEQRAMLSARFFGLGVLFALMHQAEGPFSDSDTGTHPEPHIRYFMAVPVIIDAIEKEFPPLFAGVEQTPDQVAYAQLSKCFPQLWTDSLGAVRPIRTSVLQELITTIQRLELRFASFGEARMRSAGVLDARK